jgi:hypothetical protein
MSLSTLPSGQISTIRSEASAILAGPVSRAIHGDHSLLFSSHEIVELQRIDGLWGLLPNHATDTMEFYIGLLDLLDNIVLEEKRRE